MSVNFFVEDISFTLPQKKKVRAWVCYACEEEGKMPGDINIIFVSDSYLLEINKKFLNKSYLTDVITFNNNNDNIINGDIYISIPTVKYNSKLFNTDFKKELDRVIIHGLLHLLGYNDKSNDEITVIRNKEDHYLDFFYSNTE